MKFWKETLANATVGDITLTSTKNESDREEDNYDGGYAEVLNVQSCYVARHKDEPSLELYRLYAITESKHTVTMILTDVAFDQLKKSLDNLEEEE